MKIKFESPVIFVKDIRNSRKFYEEYLDQEVEHDFGNNIMFKSRLSLWKIMETHEIQGIAGDNRMGNTMELYFETEDIEESFEMIRHSESDFLHPVKTEPWGQKTFRFFDPDRHLLEVGESLRTFISRIYKETGSVEDTSKLTGVPGSTIRDLIK